MAQQTVDIEGIGPVVIAKRRGTRNIRISINARGRVRVGLPNWLPYRAGVEFVKSHRSWIETKLTERPNVVLQEAMAIGKAHRLHFKLDENRLKPTTRVGNTTIEIISRLPTEHPQVQKAALAASERALKQQAARLLPQRLATLAHKHGFSYKAVRVRKLTSRWGSCSSQGVITLSYLLVQLPWHLIDYVLLHELAHTKHMNHSRDFWSTFEASLPTAKTLRKEIRKLQPQLLPAQSS